MKSPGSYHYFFSFQLLSIPWGCRCFWRRICALPKIVSVQHGIIILQHELEDAPLAYVLTCVIFINMLFFTFLLGSVWWQELRNEKSCFTKILFHNCSLFDLVGKSMLKSHSLVRWNEILAFIWREQQCLKKYFNYLISNSKWQSRFLQMLFLKSF